MANLKEANLMFSEEDFREVDAADLFINLWTYNYFKKHLPPTMYLPRRVLSLLRENLERKMV